MKPDQADTVPGFLSGFSDDFKNALSRVKVVTYGNTVTDDGSAVVTYDKIFLPSLQEIYCNPQVSGEGTYWPYWKERTGAKTHRLCGRPIPCVLPAIWHSALWAAVCGCALRIVAAAATLSTWAVAALWATGTRSRRFVAPRLAKSRNWHNHRAIPCPVRK